MAILNELNLEDINDLRTEATSFQNHSEELKNLTSSMLQMVRDTNSVWGGEAQTAYVGKFDSLQTSFDYMFQMVTEYVNDLNDIASNYEAATSDNIQVTNALNSEINLIRS